MSGPLATGGGGGGGIVRVTRIKTVATARGSSSTYTVDNDFTIPVAAGERVRVDFHISYQPGGTGLGFKMRFKLPSWASSTPTWGGICCNNSTISPLAFEGGLYVGQSNLTSALNATGALPRNMIGYFEATVGATGGNLEMEWAQANSGSSATSLLENSVVTKTTITAS